MNPSIKLRIHTMIRALNEIIIPAVDRENALAQEQANLLVGHLHVLLQHEGREQVMCEIEHAELKRLASALVEVSSGGSATAAATARVRNLPYDVDTDTLSHAIEALVIDSGIDGGDAFKLACDRLVIEHGREATRRSRIWFKSMGFDHDPGALPGIESLFED